MHSINVNNPSESISFEQLSLSDDDGVKSEDRNIEVILNFEMNELPFVVKLMNQSIFYILDSEFSDTIITQPFRR